jgi:Rrf2 family protein
MRLSSASSYALSAMAYMTTDKHKGKIVPSHIVAAARGIPERFLLKVLKPLVSARILSSTKGPNGGYKLARSPKDLTLLEIIEAVDGPIRGQVPRLEHDANGRLDRQLESICNKAAAVMRGHLGKVKLASLLSK